MKNNQTFGGGTEAVEGAGKPAGAKTPDCAKRQAGNGRISAGRVEDMDVRAEKRRQLIDVMTRMGGAIYQKKEALS